MNIINEDQIFSMLDTTGVPTDEAVNQVLARSKRLERLSIEDVSTLIKANTPVQLESIFSAARDLKHDIYGNRIVFFAPLYISNFCKNDCLYCAFRSSNKIARNALSSSEIISETQVLLDQGHKRVLLVAGESYPNGKDLDYILDAIDTVYSVRSGKDSIRRINVNIAPLDAPDFARLKAKNIGTYQLFQETYHQDTYKQVHVSGPKSDYTYRLSALDRAIDAGFGDVGAGVLLGLYDWRFEVLAMLQHIEHLEKKYGIGPHTISVPRIEPAEGSPFADAPPYAVNDEDFKKIIAILRLAVPYTGIILSTRETAQLRKEALFLGVSQVSAGSRTNPGGYSDQTSGPQFSLGDHRTLDEVIFDLLDSDHLPSFCTACYRTGRTGLDFMEYARPGDIRKKCEPNGLITFKEYLTDFASPVVKKLGTKKLINWAIEMEDGKAKDFLMRALREIDEGQRDLFL